MSLQSATASHRARGPLCRGTVRYVDDRQVLLARGRGLYRSVDGGESWVRIASLPLGSILEASASVGLGERLARSGFHHVVIAPQGQIVCVANRHLYALQPDGSIQALTTIRGSRPLCVAVLDDGVYYGEYVSNETRGPVKVLRVSFREPANEQIVWEFDAIRHVHGIHHDIETGALWITTGDEDHESTLWRTDDRFGTVSKVLSGSQQTRIVQPVFARDCLYFGSDAPHERNHLYRMQRDGCGLTQLNPVGGSVFYGCRVADSVFFSTAVEPSEVNTLRDAELWGTTTDRSFERIASFRKDLWPIKLFQYGRILFPNGPGDGRNLWFSPASTRGGGYTYRIPIADAWHSDGRAADR